MSEGSDHYSCNCSALLHSSSLDRNCPRSARRFVRGCQCGTLPRDAGTVPIDNLDRHTVEIVVTKDPIRSDPYRRRCSEYSVGLSQGLRQISQDGIVMGYFYHSFRFAFFAGFVKL